MDLKLQPDFKDLLRLLNSNGVKYLVIGGYAVVMYGYVRTTVDLDVAVQNDPENLSHLGKALSEFGFGEDSIDKESFIQKNSRIIMGVEPNKIDILNFIKGVDFDAAYERRNVVAFATDSIDVISLDDLLVNKRQTARLKDLADVEELEKRNS